MPGVVLIRLSGKGGKCQAIKIRYRSVGGPSKLRIVTSLAFIDPLNGAYHSLDSFSAAGCDHSDSPNAGHEILGRHHEKVHDETYDRVPGHGPGPDPLVRD
jgi:hypothetical protein